MPSAGALLCLASAAAFGAMGIFGKLAYDEGATVGTLLAVRFALAAALFWLLVACTRRRRAACARSRAATSRIALALGAVGYSAQAGAYFAALERLDASLLSLLALHVPRDRHGGRDRARARAREPADGRRAGARLDRPRASSWPGPAPGRWIRSARRSGSTAAVVYSAYILSSEGIAARIGPLALSTLVCTGAATTLTLGGVVGGEPRPGRA